MRSNCFSTMQVMFVHLRLHTEFSVIDGTTRIDDSIKVAAADQQPALAITDLGNLFLTIPPNNEQVKIVEHIENLNCKISDTIQSYKTQIDRLKEYKNILINQSVTGKIKI